MPLITLWMAWHLGWRGYSLLAVLAVSGVIGVTLTALMGVSDGLGLSIVNALVCLIGWGIGLGCRRLFGGGQKFTFRMLEFPR